mgnify:FL=1
MGLERLVAVLNSLESNYDTDLFTPLFDTIHSFTHQVPIYSQANSNQQYAYRLLADHARMFTIAIGDGLVPEKKGIGGLVKKMIERATRIAHEYLHIDEENVAILSKLIPVVTKILSSAYPDLTNKLNRTVELVKQTELNYMKKYQLAKPLLEQFIQQKQNMSDFHISGKEISDLYSGKINQTNVPLEMIEDYTRLFPNFKVDWQTFESIMREESRKSKQFSIYNKTMRASEHLSHHPIDQLADLIKQNPSISSTIDEPFKYQIEKALSAQVQLIIELNSDSQLSIVDKVDPTKKYYLILDKTNFYSAAGGQASDRGSIQFSDNQTFEIE